MLVGRNYRKAISQGLAFALFRWIAIWILVGACVSYGQPVGTTGALIIIAVDIIARANSKALSFFSHDGQRKQWMDTLTNRIFYRLLLEDIRESGPNRVDVDELFKKAAQEAIADIKKADQDSKIESGWLDSTAWHWFGGALSFVGEILGYGLYYGSAFSIFSKY